MSRLRFRGRVRVGTPPDPDRWRRALPPTASLEDHIDDFVGWMIAGGLQPDDAKRRGEWIREYRRQAGLNFLTLPPRDIVAFIAECDRQLEELDREEAKDSTRPPPGEPEH